VLQRLLLVVLILFVVWKILVAWGRRLMRSAPGAASFSRFQRIDRSQRRRRSGAAASKPEELAACAGCGTYVPAGRMVVTEDGRRFCGEECRAAYRRPTADGAADG
jgi:hypothetical protein